MKKKILAIFTCFNRKEKTLSCIKGLLEENPGISLDFLAVDDKSTDGTAEALEQMECVTMLYGTGGLYGRNAQGDAICEAAGLDV